MENNQPQTNNKLWKIFNAVFWITFLITSSQNINTIYKNANQAHQKNIALTIFAITQLLCWLILILSLGYFGSKLLKKGAYWLLSLFGVFPFLLPLAGYIFIWYKYKKTLGPVNISELGNPIWKQ
jgi:hypothetical protein